MSIEQNIREKIEGSLSPDYFEILNESHSHNVPPNSETHFKLIIVADQFNGKTRIQRHQIVNILLESELSKNIHALSMMTLTPSEWVTKKNEQITPSPKCLGGKKTIR